MTSLAANRRARAHVPRAASDVLITVSIKYVMLCEYFKRFRLLNNYAYGLDDDDLIRCVIYILIIDNSLFLTS